MCPAPISPPGQLTNGWISTLSGQDDDVSVCRMSRTFVDGRVSRLEFEYLIGTPAGIERRSEVHQLTLFTQGEMEAAFVAAGLTVERLPEVLPASAVSCSAPVAAARRPASVASPMPLSPR